MLQFKTGLRAMAVVAMMGVAAEAQAGPTLEFDFTETAVGAFTPPIGYVRLTQNGANSVDVLVDLPTGYGFINTGNKTPFTFNVGLTGALTVAFINPVGGAYVTPNGTNGQLSYHVAPPVFPATPFGDFNNAIEMSTGNGSSRGYFGDLSFTVTRAGGLSTTDFVGGGNNNAYYFAADVSNNANSGSTGSIATFGPTRTIPPGGGPGPGTDVPEPASMAIFGVGLALLGGASRFRRRS